MNRHSRIQCYITLTFPTFPLLFVSTTTRRGRLLFRARPRGARYFPLLPFLFLLRLCLSARARAKRHNLGLCRLKRDSYVVERECVTINNLQDFTRDFSCEMKRIKIMDATQRSIRAFLDTGSSNWPSQRNRFSRTTLAYLPLSTREISSPLTRHSPFRYRSLVIP